ncbi:MAG: hypothetical protein HQK56_20535 [Deltaproteobacteria bacterium]|nr:hypothetical protein [Deltaproteobacteria bacterium]
MEFLLLLKKEDGSSESISFISNKGISDYLDSQLDHREVITRFPILIGEGEGNSYEIALAVLSSSSGESFHSYVNGVRIEDSSTPVVALRQSFARAIRQYLQDHAILSKKDQLIKVETSDIRSGLISILKLLHKNPSFSSQEKSKLINTDISELINQTLPQKILAFLLTQPGYADKIVQQALLQAKARIAAAKARQATLNKPNGPSTSSLNYSYDVYTPPLSKDKSLNSLYLFEGQSASGTLVKAGKLRDATSGKLYKEHVGILALRGIPLNSLELELSRVVKNTEFATLIDVAGLNMNDPKDLSGLNFRDFIIATDEDAGGKHCASLLITFFLAHFPEVIRQGKLYRVETPFFIVQNQKSKDLHYIYSDENEEDKIKEFGYDPKDAGKLYTVTRIKGLGEIPDHSIHTLVREPRLVQIKYDDISEMLNLYYIFSGKNFVPERKKLIFDLGLNIEDSD